MSLICSPILAGLMLNSPRLWPLALVGAALAMLLVWRLYLPQVRLLHQPWRMLLPLLRYSALLALVGSILKPVAVRPATAPEAGAILVLVDRSRSMSARDMAYLSQNSQAGAAASRPSVAPLGANGIVSPFQRNSLIFQQSQLVSMADGFGLLKPGARDLALANLHDEVAHLRTLTEDLGRTRSELNFARLSDQGLAISRQRFNNSAAQFRAAGTKLMGESSAFIKPGQINNPFPALAKVLRATDDHLLDDALNTTLTLSRWADDAQNNADSQLYQTNPDVRAACDRLAGMSRFARVETALTQPDAGLLSKIPADVPLFGYAIGDEIEALPLRGEGRNVRRLLTEPQAAHSDLLGGVRAALGRIAGQPLQAIVLISDGRQTGPSDPAAYTAMVTQLGAVGVPLFFVYCPPDNLRLRDQSVGAMAPQTSFVGENLTARVQLSTADLNAGTTIVSLSVDGAPPTTRPASLALAAQIFPQSYNAPQGASFAPARQTIEFPLQFQKAGVHHLAASIPSFPDAPTDDNKRIERWIKVLDDKVNVGIFAGEAGWDYQYVSSALARTPWANINHGIISAEQKLNLTPEQILDQSVMILFDVPEAALSDAQWEAVYKLANERGGSVILVPGEEHLPAEYAQNKNAAALLPFQAANGQVPFWRNWPGKEAGFHIAPARSAADLDALRLNDDHSIDGYAQLPSFFRFFSLPELKPSVVTLLEERDSTSALLVENRVGLGRAFFMGMNETWRWRMKVGERDQDRFWLQLVRYASDEPYAAHAPGVWLDASVVAAEPGQSIHLRARVEDAVHNPAKQSKQVVDVTRNGAVISQITLSHVGSADAASGRYQGNLTGLAAGDYQLRLASPTGGQPASLDLHIAPSFEEEMSNLTGAPGPMRRLAETSGGSYLPLSQIGSLATLINRTQFAQSRTVQRPLWDSMYLFAFVVACFGAEWAIRKRVGLV